MSRLKQIAGFVLVFSLMLTTACGNGEGGSTELSTDDRSEGAADAAAYERTDHQRNAEGEPSATPVSRKLELPDIFAEDEAKDFAEAARANRAFGFNWFDTILKEYEQENLIVSPYSANMALSMLLRGAEENTYDEIAGALLVAGIKEAENLRQQALLLRHLAQREDVTLSVANSIWHREDLPASDAYLEDMRQYYGAEIAGVNFEDPDAPKQINDWVSEHTMGKIQAIVPDKLDPSTFMYLINALYLQASWDEPFDAERTADGSFRLTNGETVQVPMMNQEEVLQAYKGDAFQAVRLGLGSSAKMSMTLILPHESKGWEEVRNELRETDGEGWNKLFAPYTVNLTVPKFKIEQELSLVESLQALGMNSMFDTRAQLGRLAGWDIEEGPSLYVDDALQKTYLEIDEEGLEAAAVTAIKVVLTSAMEPPESMTLVFDRPFYFLIEDLESGAVLFMGAVQDPSGE